MNQPRKTTLIGAGIMSATLGIILKKIMPNTIIDIYKHLDKVVLKVRLPRIMLELDSQLFVS